MDAGFGLQIAFWEPQNKRKTSSDEYVTSSFLTMTFFFFLERRVQTWEIGIPGMCFFSTPVKTL